MAQTLQEFIKDKNGKIVGVNAADMGQCTGLVMAWFANIGASFEYGNAKDLLNAADRTFFNVISNSPDNVPLPGDALVWGEQVGEFGHTAIFISGDANSFLSFDQNWPVGSSCHVQSHNYSGVIGWLSPKTPPPAPVAPPTLSDSTNYDFGGSLGLLSLGTVRSKLLDSERAVKSLNDQLLVLTTQRDSLAAQLSLCINEQHHNTPIITLANFSKAELFSELVKRFVGR